MAASDVTAPRMSEPSRIGGSFDVSSPSRRGHPGRPGSGPRVHEEAAGGVARIHGDLAGQAKIDEVLRHQDMRGLGIGLGIVIAQPGEFEAGGQAGVAGLAVFLR